MTVLLQDVGFHWDCYLFYLSSVSMNGLVVSILCFQYSLLMRAICSSILSIKTETNVDQKIILKWQSVKKLSLNVDKSEDLSNLFCVLIYKINCLPVLSLGHFKTLFIQIEKYYILKLQ